MSEQAERDLRKALGEASVLARKNERLRTVLQAIVKHGDANGMQNWKVMRMARKELADEQSKP